MVLKNLLNTVVLEIAKKNFKIKKVTMFDKYIYVSTIIDSYNYGTVLQAVATRDVLGPYGKPLFIDYCREAWTHEGLRDIYLKDMNHFLPINIVRYFVALPELKTNKKLFRSFVERQLHLVDANPFIAGSGRFDEQAVYCVGSDQTWNEELNKGIDPVYTLKNVPSDCRKISLSASFGRPSIPDAEAAKMKPLLEQFDAISVRESSSVSILEQMGIKGSVALKDPVLLCRPQLWHELSHSVPKYKDQYVLIYMLNHNQRMIGYAQQLAEEKGLKVRIVTFSPRKPGSAGCESICQPTPEQWLAAFRDADYVVTDSFHGTCFSILFNKPMIVFDPPRYSVRLTDVLKDFDLSDRRTDNQVAIKDIDTADGEIDWGPVQTMLADFRKVASEFLDKYFTAL